jgi:hypothetical protein
VIADRASQAVVALTLEPRTEQIFHRDSYGYRAGQVGASGAGSMPGTVLEEGLGARYRHPGVLGCGITLLLGLM